MPDWNPELYLKFGAERTRPALDLALRARTLVEAAATARPTAAAVPGAAAASAAILDLGCGPGNSTAVLAAVFPGAAFVGIDSSPDMISTARASGLAAEWQVADASIWEPGRSFGLVFSNAVLQWIPDQVRLLARMWSWLAPGGVLAVQVPGNGGSPLHRALRRTAADAAWRSRFAGRASGVDDAIRYQEPPFYYDTLAPLGGTVDIWETTYWHLLGGQAALIDWYSGSGMRPWLERLGEAEGQAFKQAVLDAAAPEYPVRPDGSVFFPFRRIFVTAVKAPQGVAQ